uniref:P2X purinoreceptor 7 intracellular domain-containing protein n=1 Tax=Nothobranchius korthausae TaxID=1143690 RepID=A0A1A8G121_9TELE
MRKGQSGKHSSYISRPAGRRGTARSERQKMQPNAEEQRVSAMLEERRLETEELLQTLTLEEYRDLGRELFARKPELVFDAPRNNQARSGAPPPADLLGIPPWCTCGSCRDMPTLLERKCCGQEPNHCVRLLPHFSLFCLDEGNLQIHRQFREDLMAVRPAREAGDDNREYRYAAYRHFIFWQRGALGRGNRLVIPSCCVWAVRDRYPDPYGQYKGFVPGC